MRIGMILDAPFPPDPRVENEALSLIQANHEVILFSLNFTKQSCVEENYKNIQIIRYSSSKLLYKLSALAYTLPFYKWKVSNLITDFIKTYKIEALHVHDMVIAEAAFDANTLFNLPVVLDLHENRPEIMKDYKHVNTITGKLLINLKKWSKKYYALAQQADRVLVVTEAAKQDIILNTGKDGKKIIVVPNSVHPAKFLNTPTTLDIAQRMQGSFNILYIGDTSVRRGIDTAIRAVSLIQTKIPTIKLWLVGKSSADTFLKQLSIDLKVQDHVIFEGWQSPSLFLSYLRSTALALSPLKRNIHHDTTYANKLFQYMICSVPLVVSDCTAQAELVTNEQCGLVHIANDPESLAAKIYHLYTHKDEAIALGKNGESAVLKRWNWDFTVKELLHVYNTNFQN